MTRSKLLYMRTATDYAQQVVAAIMDRLAHDPNRAVETELADAILEWCRSPFCQLRNQNQPLVSDVF